MILPSPKFVAFGLLAMNNLVGAHPGEDEFIHPADVGHRQLETTGRHIQARNCAPQIAAHIATRKAKRALEGKPRMHRRGIDSLPQGIAPWRRHGQIIARAVGDSTPVASAKGPTYTNIQNSTCVTAPEVTEGPYYINNELVRSDVREGEAGIDLLLDIGVIDTTTCQPLEDAFVEIWSCNATGSYAGFTQVVLGPPPSSTAPTPAGGRPLPGMSDQLTFLRGGAPTNENGILEFKTIYPGYYTGRTIHIHAMVQTKTIGSKNGDLHHIGQIFFDDALTDQVVTLPTYSNTTQTRTRNEQDRFLQGANTDGYNSFADAEPLGESIEDGVLAYITIGVDTSRHVNITTNNYAQTITWEATPTAGLF
ncbi:putative extracellular dioxygenase [Rhizoctonia solani 123E]|uniref:Putative extracellular dioxygenase n=1 Tax=Rhizoctonia solani 123E TaxID=1423351 RepID=A0A074SEV1_9AGAM|nr:putative extracellular dioxygenase [Rhizoctonia solani 123E]